MPWKQALHLHKPNNQNKKNNFRKAHKSQSEIGDMHIPLTTHLYSSSFIHICHPILYKLCINTIRGADISIKPLSPISTKNKDNR